MKQICRNLNQACSLSTTKENKGITEMSDNGVIIYWFLMY